MAVDTPVKPRAPEPPAGPAARVLRPLWWLLALLLLAYEWLWDALLALMARWARLPAWSRLEARLTRLPPYPALALLALPALLIVPVKLGAVALLAHGRWLAGALLLLGAKLAGTALVARLFTLMRPSLLSIGWFSHLYATITRALDRAHAWLEGSTPWPVLRAWARRWRDGLRACLSAWRRALSD